MKNRKWLHGGGGVLIAALLLLGSIAFSGCSLDDGTVYVKNLSATPITDAIVTMQLYQGTSKLAERDVHYNQEWQVTGCPTGVSLHVRVVDGANIPWNSLPFTLSSGGSKHLRFNGFGVVND